MKEEGLLSTFLEMQIAWSTSTFGPSKRTLGITRHIRKELAEIEAKPDDLTEWIDVMILALDGYWRHGGKPETVMRDLLAKADINHSRAYSAPTSEDEPCEHVRDTVHAYGDPCPICGTPLGRVALNADNWHIVCPKCPRDYGEANGSDGKAHTKPAPSKEDLDFLASTIGDACLVYTGIGPMPDEQRIARAHSILDAVRDVLVPIK